MWRKYDHVENNVIYSFFFRFCTLNSRRHYALYSALLYYGFLWPVMFPRATSLFSQNALRAKNIECYIIQDIISLYKLTYVSIYSVKYIDEIIWIAVWNFIEIIVKLFVQLLNWYLSCSIFKNVYYTIVFRKSYKYIYTYIYLFISHIEMSSYLLSTRYRYRNNRIERHSIHEKFQIRSHFNRDRSRNQKRSLGFPLSPCPFMVHRGWFACTAR